MPYDAVRDAVAAACARNGLRCVIETGEPSVEYGLFQDAYHLNRAGSARFTAALRDRYLAPSTPQGTPVVPSSPPTPATRVSIAPAPTVEAD